MAREHADNAAFKSLAQLRLARVQLASGKPQEALDTLHGLPKDDYAGIASELEGDALSRLKREDEARTAYKKALDAYGDGAIQRRLVQLKLDDLAVAGKQGS